MLISIKLEDIQILKSYFTDYKHTLIMNFLLNSFQSKSNKFMVESIDNLY